MFRRPELRISAGFWLLIAWFGLINGWDLLLVVLLSAAFHELGHCVVLLLLGARIRCLQVGVCGAVLETDSGSTLSYGGELAVLLAGPGMNFLCAILALALDGWNGALFAGVNLLLCAFNLIPLQPLDGGRILFLLISWLFGPSAGERISGIIGTVVGMALAGMIFLLMWRSGGSLWLLPAFCGVLGAVWREMTDRKSFL